MKFTVWRVLELHEQQQPEHSVQLYCSYTSWGVGQVNIFTRARNLENLYFEFKEIQKLFDFSAVIKPEKKRYANSLSNSGKLNLDTCLSNSLEVTLMLM